jgi:protein-disulfide isomerase
MIGGAMVLSNVTRAKPVDSDVLAGDARHVKGNSNAMVTVVEFSDFQCLACKVSFPEFDRIINKYGEDIRLIYRHFPIVTSHPLAMDAAIASEVAAKQGKFWEMHDLLFYKQDDWVEAGYPKEMFIEYARELGIDPEQFSTELESSKYRELVNVDINDARVLGVNATPTIYVNDKQVKLSELEKVLDSMLQR